jgi:phage-related protein
VAEHKTKRIPAVFYRAGSGTEPVRAWLKGLSDEDRRIIGLDIATVEYGWPVGMPICRGIAGRRGLWEVRSSLPGGRIARVLFCIYRSRLVLLHGFLKKTEKTPDGDLDIAMKRKKEVDR